MSFHTGAFRGFRAFFTRSTSEGIKSLVAMSEDMYRVPFSMGGFRDFRFTTPREDVSAPESFISGRI